MELSKLFLVASRLEANNAPATARASQLMN
jgi:hypothetical protein